MVTAARRRMRGRRRSGAGIIDVGVRTGRRGCARNCNAAQAAGARASSGQRASTPSSTPGDGRRRKDLPRAVDVVVVGAGIGGLSAAAVLAWHGYRVAVLESHSKAGGAAHGFSRSGFNFETGPSFHAGLSADGEASGSPLRDVLELIGEADSIEYVQYTQWLLHIPEGIMRLSTERGESGVSRYVEELSKPEFGGASAGGQMERLMRVMEPVMASAVDLKARAIRWDLSAAVTLARYAPALARSGMVAGLLQGPFKALIDRAGVTSSFLRRLLDVECFMLSGLGADGTISAEMAFMFGERMRPGATVDYPIGGSVSIVDALVRGVRKGGGEVFCNAHVDEIEMDDARGAVGVRLRDGRCIRARRAVVSNASIWDTAKLCSIPEDAPRPGSLERMFAANGFLSLVRPSIAALLRSFGVAADRTPRTGSFMHLHVGFDAEGLPQGRGAYHELDCHHIVVNDWEAGLDAPGNCIGVSIPSVFDPGLAPKGKHVLHAYCAANEPFELWERFLAPAVPGGPNGESASEGSSGRVKKTNTRKDMYVIDSAKRTEYEKLKSERSECLWRAIERVIPDIRSRAEVSFVGTPLTHARYLRRHKGTYGPAHKAGQSAFPTATVAGVPRLYCVGDSTAPGIGVPAVAASGLICANTVSTLDEHIRLLDKLDAIASEC